MDVATFVCEDVVMDDDQARQDIIRARDDMDEARDAAEQARQRLHKAIADAQRDQTLRVRELVELTGYDREHIRRIARSAGVPSSR